MISSISPNITNNNLSTTNFMSNRSIKIPVNYAAKNCNEKEDSWLLKWFKEYIKSCADRFINIYAPTKSFCNDSHKKIGFLTVSFPEKKKMSIDYLEVDSDLRKRPQESASTLIEIVKYILKLGKNKSVEELVCFPMDDKQTRLYKKFGFKPRKNDYLGASFEDFKKRAEVILKALSSSLKSSQK